VKVVRNSRSGLPDRNVRGLEELIGRKGQFAGVRVESPVLRTEIDGVSTFVGYEQVVVVGLEYPGLIEVKVGNTYFWADTHGGLPLNVSLEARKALASGWRASDRLGLRSWLLEPARPLLATSGTVSAYAATWDRRR
jgi:hypothetical protein